MSVRATAAQRKFKESLTFRLSVWWASAATVGTLVWGGDFSLVANGTLPYALSMVPPTKAGLGTGLYFSGGAVAMSVLGSLGSNLGFAVSLLVAAISFAAAAGCVLAKQP